MILSFQELVLFHNFVSLSFSFLFLKVFIVVVSIALVWTYSMIFMHSPFFIIFNSLLFHIRGLVSCWLSYSLKWISVFEESHRVFSFSNVQATEKGTFCSLRWMMNVLKFCGQHSYLWWLKAWHGRGEESIEYLLTDIERPKYGSCHNKGEFFIFGKLYFDAFMLGFIRFHVLMN